MRKKLCKNIPKEMIEKYSRELKESGLPVIFAKAFLTIELQCLAKYKHEFMALIKEMKKGGTTWKS